MILTFTVTLGLSFSAHAASPGDIITVAGNGTAAFSGDNGAATAASLNNPHGVVLDSAGNLYIADSSNYRIRKVEANSEIITNVAGSSTNLWGNLINIGGFAGDNGVAIAAKLDTPNGVTIDSIGNLYIADTANHRIRKVAVGSGIITTVAGNGTGTFAGDGGSATAASLYFPTAVTVDNSGNLYIADYRNHRIRKVAAISGVISTVAGNGNETFGGDGLAATSASLYYPSGVAVDSTGNIYIADQFNHRIRKVNTVSGTITTVAGRGWQGFSGDGFAATSADFAYPAGVTVDSGGNLYIADRGNNRIRKITAVNGIITTVAGNGIAAFAGDDGPAASASINAPNGVSVDNSGNLYIADSVNNRIRKVINPGGTSAVINYSPTGPYKAGDLVTITATFYDALADTPAPKISLSGVNTLSTTAMTKVDSKHYSYNHTITEGYGTVTVSLPNCIDINGVPLSLTPSGGATFRVFTSPLVTTGAASSVTTTRAIFNATINDQGADTSITYEYGLSTSYGTNINSGILSAGTGSTAVNSFIITGLTCGTTYHYRVNGQNSAGLINGLDAIFTTNACPVPESWIINTVAGNGVGDKGAATSAILWQPTAVTLDSAGNLYIADSWNNRIRKVAATSGIITTIAGNGTASFGGDGAQATSASLNVPYGVAVDSAGNLYIADSWNNRIRKVTAASGIITTIAGNGTATFGGDGAQATLAGLNNPQGIAIDSAGNLYITDMGNNRIRKVTAASGIITTVDGMGGSLNNPRGVTIDSAGNLYIADTGNNRIFKVAADTGIITIVAGNGSQSFCGDGYPATTACLKYPSGVTIDSVGNLYISDLGNYRIRKVSATSGIITTVAGNGAGTFGGDMGPATSASINYSYGVAVDKTGNLYIADFFNNRIRKVTATSGIITTIAGRDTNFFGGDGTNATSANLYNPSGVAVDSAKNLYIADTLNNRIRKVAAGTGVITTVAGNDTGTFAGDGGAATSSSLYSPFGVAVDSARNLYIADSSNNRIRKVTAATGIITTVAGNGAGTYNYGTFSGDGGAATSAGLNHPNGVAVDSTGNLYIADSQNNRIRKVAAVSGIITTAAGTGDEYSPIGDGGAATSAGLSYPNGVAVDSTGNLYIADTGNNRIRKVTAATGIITTVAGNDDWNGGDGDAATLAVLNSPLGVSVDSAGNVYIADTGNNRIRKVAAINGIITTVAGNSTIGEGGDGGLTTLASLNNPTGVTVDSFGHLYIADRYNNRIRKILKLGNASAAISYSPAGPYKLGETFYVNQG